MNQLVNAINIAEAEIRDKFDGQIKKELTAKRFLFGAGAVVGLLVVGGVVIAALTLALHIAVLGSLLGALAFGGLVAYKKLPQWLLSIENRERERIVKEMNRHLASLKSEAKKNPIEQAQNEYLRRSRQYDAFKTAIESIGGKVGAFKSKLDKTKKERPKYDLLQETAAYERMKEFYDNRKVRLETAFVKLAQFHDKIEEANTKWEFQLAANEAIRAMNATDQETKINEILTEVAFDSVQQEFDAVFARLDVDAAEINASRALEFGQGVTIDVSAIHIEQSSHEAVHLEAAKR
jgi:hypothetical protein